MARSSSLNRDVTATRTAILPQVPGHPRLAWMALLALATWLAGLHSGPLRAQYPPAGPNYPPPGFQPPPVAPPAAGPGNSNAGGPRYPLPQGGSPGYPPPRQASSPPPLSTYPAPASGRYPLPGSAGLGGDPRVARRTPTPTQLFESAQIVARVGNQLILAGDVLPQINQALAAYEGQVSDEELAAQRDKYMQQLVESSIEYKLMYLDFLRSIPKEKFDEAWDEIQQKLSEDYEKSELPKALKQAKVETPAELDAKLREFGSSLAKQKRTYRERKLAAAQVRRKVEFDPEITHDAMLQYYNKNRADYAIRPAARWEQLMARFDKHASKAEAFRAIANMGNDVLRGAPFAAVAKRHSQGFSAEEGGRHDWTNQGSLVSKKLDESLFTLPLNELSPILEDEQGFHIIRIIERRPGGFVPFTDAQVKIREQLRTEKVKAGIAEYIKSLRASTSVWTVFEQESVQR